MWEHSQCGSTPQASAVVLWCSLSAHRIRICTWTREESFAIVSSGNSLAAPLLFTKVEMSRVASHRKLSLTASPQGLLEHPRQERDPLSGEGAQDPMSSQRAILQGVAPWQSRCLPWRRL